MIHIKDIVKSTPIGIKRQAKSPRQIKNNLISPSRLDQIINFSLDYLSSVATYAEIRLLNALVSWSSYRRNVFPSQDRLAKEIGISRGHCNRLIKKLVEAGLIKSIYRHWYTCVYRIASFFFHPRIRKALAPFLSKLAVVTLITLVMGLQILGMEKKVSNFENVTPSQVPKNKNLEIASNTLVCKSNYEDKTTKSSPDQRAIRSSLYKSDINQRKELWVKHPTTGKDICLPLAAELFPINGIDLTIWALINLTVFPDKVIKHAKDVFKTIDKKNVSDPYRWLFTHCVAYCLREDIEPDYGLANRLSMQHEMPTNAPMLRKRSYHPTGSYETPAMSRHSSSRVMPDQARRLAPVIAPLSTAPSSADKTSTVAAHNRYLTLEQSIRQDAARRNAESAALAPEKKNAWLQMFPVPEYIKKNTGDHHEAKERDEGPV